MYVSSNELISDIEVLDKIAQISINIMLGAFEAFLGFGRALFNVFQVLKHNDACRCAVQQGVNSLVAHGFRNVAFTIAQLPQVTLR